MILQQKELKDAINVASADWCEFCINDDEFCINDDEFCISK